MQTVNIHEAKTHLSRLLARAAKGESFIIAKAGKPIAKMVPIDADENAPKKKRRFGFLQGQFTTPDDFDTMAAEEIQAMFEGRD